MAVVTKTFSFASDAEGLSQTYGPVISGSWDSGDGSPSSGCIKVTGTATGGDECDMATSGTTFETWGVPSGATINGIEIKSAKIKASDVSTFPYFESSMSGSGGGGWAANHANGYPSSANTWESLNGVVGYVDLTANSLTSTSECLLSLIAYTEYTGAFTIRIDTIVVEITYTGGGGGGGLSIPVAMQSYRQRRV